MASNPWVRSLSAPARSALLEAAEPVAFRTGELLYRSSEDTGTFWGLVEGHVRVSTLRPDGQEAVLTILEPGNWFGEMSMVDHLPRTHDATATGPVRLLAVRQAAFDRLMERADFAHGIAALLAARMRLLFAVFEDATLHGTQARVARRLLHLSRGDATLQSGRRAVVRVSQDVLARMLGITRQTLSAELQAMAEAGAIATGYGRVEIRSAERLLALAGPAGGQAAPVEYRTTARRSDAPLPRRRSGDRTAAR
jgi:CRP/FNR family cyclic AMP-dependent transcriptional regulator